MAILVFLGCISILYVMLMFFDFFFKSCMMLPYLEFISSTGITIKFFRLQFYTTSFNRTIVKWSSRFPSLYRHSFKLGAYMAIALFPFAMLLILYSLFVGPSTTSPSSAVASSSDVARLEILLPGVNLPLNEIGYYLLSLLICSVVHEAGHGIAAVLEDIQVCGFGLSLIFIIPIAYTEIDSEQLQSAKVWKRLRVYSAGIWNNALLAAWAYGLLMLLPILLAPIYAIQESVIITSIKPKAPLVGEKGLHVDDIITHINGCPTRDEAAWFYCLTDTVIHHPAFCVKEEFVHENDETIHEVEHLKDGLIACCPTNSALNCFENFDEERLPQYVCLNIRNTVEHSQDYCHYTECQSHSSCVKPILPNKTTIIHMKRRNRTKDIVYYGHPMDVLRFVEISSFVPKTSIFGSGLADGIALLLKYLTVFSSGLAIVNVVPCYGLDGQYLSAAMISALPGLSKSRKELLAFTINLFGTGSLFLSIIKIFWTTFSI